MATSLVVSTEAKRPTSVFETWITFRRVTAAGFDFFGVREQLSSK
jgi:hypothetical protein